MTFQEFTPSPFLRLYVDRYWLVETFPSDLHPMEHILTPNGMDGLVWLFQTEAPQSFLNANGPQDLPACYGLIQPSYAWRLQIPTPCGIVGAFFKPGVLHRWLRYPMGELSGRPIDMEAIVGGQIVHLNEQMRNTANQRIELLESFLAKRLPVITPRLSYADYALQLIIQQQGNQSIQSMADQLRVSRQFLARQFDQQVGISPKHFGRVVRFNALHRLIACNKQPNWLDMVCEFGYYDQAHLIKDFHDFIGCSPTDYLVASTEAADFYAGKSR